ncbi:MAG: hypothetical protein AAB254_06165, partial [candidate division NC10 bacterium]
ARPTRRAGPGDERGYLKEANHVPHLGLGGREPYSRPVSATLCFADPSAARAASGTEGPRPDCAVHTHPSAKF